LIFPWSILAVHLVLQPRITMPQSKVSAWVIPTNEELMIARHMARMLEWGD